MQRQLTTTSNPQNSTTFNAQSFVPDLLENPDNSEATQVLPTTVVDGVEELKEQLTELSTSNSKKHQDFTDAKENTEIQIQNLQDQLEAISQQLFELGEQEKNEAQTSYELQNDKQQQVEQLSQLTQQKEILITQLAEHEKSTENSSKILIELNQKDKERNEKIVELAQKKGNLLKQWLSITAEKEKLIEILAILQQHREFSKVLANSFIQASETVHTAILFKANTKLKPIPGTIDDSNISNNQELEVNRSASSPALTI